MKPYLDLIRRILDDGVAQDDRTGVGTIGELLWFLRGDTMFASAGCRIAASASGTNGPMPMAISGPCTASNGGIASI